MLVTRFELYLRSHAITPAQIAHATTHSRQHILRFRIGESLPTKRAIITLTEACRAITGEDVAPESIFERADRLFRSTRQRLSEFHSQDLAALDAVIRDSSADALIEVIAATKVVSETAVLHVLRRAQRMIDRRPVAAAELFAAALTIATSLSGSPPQLVAALVGEALKGRATALRHLGDFDAALSDLEAAARQYTATKVCAREAGGVEYTRAIIYLSMEAHADAARAAGAAGRHFRDGGDRRRAAHAELVEAGIYFERGDTESARRMFLGLRKILEDARDHDALARVWLNLGACEIRRGDEPAARHWLTRASGGFRRLRNRTELLRTQWNMATFLTKFSNRRRGLRLLERVERAFTDLQMYADVACVRMDIFELLVDDEAPLHTLIDQAKRVAAAFENIRLVGTTSRALSLLQSIKSTRDARTAAMAARAELHSFSHVAKKVGGAADFAEQPTT